MPHDKRSDVATVLIQQTVQSQISLPMTTAGWASYQTQPASKMVYAWYTKQTQEPLRVYCPLPTGWQITLDIQDPLLVRYVATLTRDLLLPNTLVLKDGVTVLSQQNWRTQTAPQPFSEADPTTVDYSRARTVRGRISISSNSTSLASTTIVGNIMAASVFLTSVREWSFAELGKYSVPADAQTVMSNAATGVTLLLNEDAGSNLEVPGTHRQCNFNNTNRNIEFGGTGAGIQFLTTTATTTGVTTWLSPVSTLAATSNVDQTYGANMIPPDATPTLHMRVSVLGAGPHTLNLLHVFANMTTNVDQATNNTSTVVNTYYESENRLIGGPAAAPASYTFAVGGPFLAYTVDLVSRPKGYPTTTWIGTLVTPSAGVSILTTEHGTQAKRAEWGNQYVVLASQLGAQQSMSVSGRIILEAEAASGVTPYARVGTTEAEGEIDRMVSGHDSSDRDRTGLSIKRRLE